MKDKCIACNYPKGDWRDYECPMCYCPQHFIAGIDFSDQPRWKWPYFWIRNLIARWKLKIKLPSLMDHYRDMVWIHYRNKSGGFYEK